MILLFYNLAILAVLILGAPYWLWKMATTHKYREGLLERLGIGEPGFIRRRRAGHSPEAAPDPRPLVWLHAVSVGEALAVSRLVSEFDAAFPGFRLVVSTTTRTGQELARQRFGAERVFYCPLDLPWAVGARLRALQPRLVILAETEFWPNVLNGCFRRRIPVAVVNARISDRSWPRYRSLRRFWKPLLSRLARVLAQSQADADRLRALGCAPEKVIAAGNLKFDVRASSDAEAAQWLRARSAGLRFVVAGSTLEGEEAALLAAWPRLLAADPALVLVLAPRHPERFDAVAALIEKSGLAWARRSKYAPKERREPEPGLAAIRPGHVVLLDTIGELASVYSLAAAAFVGGSLIPAGGHNPLEPARFAVPIVIGPHYQNFRAITEDLLAHQALRVAAKEELPGAFIGILRDPAAAQAMGARARQVFERQSGATARSIEAIGELLAARPLAAQPLAAQPAAQPEAERMA